MMCLALSDPPHRGGPGRGPLLERLAAEVLGPEKARSVWKRLDIIGDIAILRVPFGMSPDELRPLAEKLLEVLPYIRSVWAAVSPVRGEYRLREFVHLAGEERSETLYREHGCVFKVDIRRVYISPRLCYEHRRVASLVQPGEVVVNMYAGAGLFSIIIAKYSRPKKVYSIDINPDAYRYMVENVRLNRVEHLVEPILGDAARVIEERLQGVADRVLMPLPDLVMEHLPYALKALKGRGYIHVYLHVDGRRPREAVREAERLVSSRLAELNAKFNIVFSRVVRSVGPCRYQVVVDVEAEA